MLCEYPQSRKTHYTKERTENHEKIHKGYQLDPGSYDGIFRASPYGVR